MAIAMLIEWPDMDHSAYDALIEALDLRDGMFRGAILHLAGPADRGHRIVDVWDSEEDFHRFRLEKLDAAVQHIGLAPPSVTTWPVDRIVTPSGPLEPQR